MSCQTTKHLISSEIRKFQENLKITGNYRRELREVDIALLLFFKYQPKLNSASKILPILVGIIKAGLTFKISAPM